MTGGVIFVTAVRTPAGKATASLMIRSLRNFGGDLGGCPVHVFALDPRTESCQGLAGGQVQVEPLELKGPLASNPFGGKVCACARAEELAPAGTHSLVWIDPACLVVQPPSLFELGDDYDAAFRPVHIRNVGLPPSEPLDAFWKGIYNSVGVADIQVTTESFVDGVRLRAYYNSHAFAINPALGLMEEWRNHFEKLVSDQAYQSAACADDDHQVFLFQAMLSALVAARLDPARVRTLPPAYNYPYHLQDRIPTDRRLEFMDQAVTVTYEDSCLHPEKLVGIKVREPLRTWLEAAFPME